VSIGALQCAASDGTRLNLLAFKPQSVYFTATLPSGRHGSFGGTFK